MWSISPDSSLINSTKTVSDEVFVSRDELGHGLVYSSTCTVDQQTHGFEEETKSVILGVFIYKRTCWRHAPPSNLHDQFFIYKTSDASRKLAIAQRNIRLPSRTAHYHFYFSDIPAVPKSPFSCVFYLQWNERFQAFERIRRNVRNLILADVSAKRRQG